MSNDERMGPFDAVMYGIEGDPLLRTPIVAVVLLQGQPDRATLTARTERLSLVYPRLRQRAVGNPFSPAPPRWEVDPHFDLDYHLRWRQLPAEDADIDGVLAFAARMGEADFDKSRPLWEIAVLTGLGDEQAAVLFKIHHSVADGMGGLAMSAALFDLERDPAELGPLPPAPKGTPAGIVDRIRQATEFELDALTETVVGAAKISFRAARAMLTDPIGSTRSLWETSTSTATMLAPQGEPRSEWMSQRSLTCIFTMVDVPLEPLKQTARDAGVTLNVVFIAAVADAIGTYHRKHGHPLAAFRLNMPVSQRKADHADTGNHWTPARYLVPCTAMNPTARLTALQSVVDAARDDPALELSEVVYKAMVLLPNPATEFLAGALMKGVDVAATNVPGPPVPVYLGGAEVIGLVPFAPKSGAAINIGLLTYDGTAYIGVNSDPAAVEDPREFTDLLTTAFAEYTGGA